MLLIGARRGLLGGPVPWEHNGTWGIGAALVNTPTLGAEMLVDPGFENWTNATTPSTWTKSIAGASTINREASVIRSGTYAVRGDVDGSSSGCDVRVAPSTVVGTWYQSSVWARSSNAGTVNFHFTAGGMASITRTLTTAYQQFVAVQRPTSAGGVLLWGRNTIPSQSFYVDDASLKALDVATLFAVRRGAANPASVKAYGTIQPGTPAGVVYGLDSVTSPQNGLVAIHNGITAIELFKMVAGVITPLIATTIAYVAGVLPEIRWNGSQYQLFYNGAQIGSNQTVADAGGGILHGVFSTSALNTITGCVVS